MNNFQDKCNFIWSVADLLRGDYKQFEYGRVILPFTVLRRLDCVLQPTKAAVLEKVEELKASKLTNIEPLLNKVTGLSFHNISKLNFPMLRNDPENITANLTGYMHGFSTKARKILEHFRFEEQITRLDQANLLYLVVAKFCDINLHPNTVSNHEMGYIFEELIRSFSEQSNETAGEHFTPREVIRLMVNLLFNYDDAALTKKGIVKTLYDPACGTGGMLFVAKECPSESILCQAHLF